MEFKPPGPNLKNVANQHLMNRSKMYFLVNLNVIWCILKSISDQQIQKRNYAIISQEPSRFALWGRATRGETSVPQVSCFYIS